MDMSIVLVENFPLCLVTSVVICAEISRSLWDRKITDTLRYKEVE